MRDTAQTCPDYNNSECNTFNVGAFPTIWMAKLWYKFTGKGIYRGTNVSFEKYIPGSDQITWWSPYDNFR